MCRVDPRVSAALRVLRSSQIVRRPEIQAQRAVVEVVGGLFVRFHSLAKVADMSLHPERHFQLPMGVGRESAE